MPKNPRLLDIAGCRFGAWTIGKQAGNTSRGGAVFNAVCDCGTERVVSSADVRSGKSKSCGCLKNELIGRLNRTHGESKTRLYNVWLVMRARCKHGWRYYGERGISVCDAWNNWPTFRDWASANGYRDDLTIDRINNDQGYYPDNCRWADKQTQSLNRSNVILMGDGTPAVLVARQNGVPDRVFRTRLSSGWPIERAVTQPPKKQASPLAPASTA